MQEGRSGAGRKRARPAAKRTRPAASGEPAHLGYARLLGQVTLFAGIDRVVLSKLAAYLEPVSHPRGGVIFRQSDPGDALYLVASGTVGVYALGHNRSTEARVRVLGPGEPFGEMALLTNDPRTATIRAETDCEVLRLERAAFLELVKREPSVALAVAATLSRRLADMTRQPGKTARAAADGVESRDGGREAPIAPAPVRARWRPGRIAIAAAAAAAVLLGGWWLPAPLDLTPSAWHALLTLLAFLPALAMDAIPEGVLALLLACAWVILGVATPAVALSGYATESWVLVVAVLMIGAAITATGVLYRLALEMVARMRGGLPGEIAALSLAGVVMGPTVPNATSRVIIIAPMLKELTEALGYRAYTPAAAGLAMAVLVGFGQMAATFLTSSTTGVLLVAVLPPAQPEIDWITWAYYAAPMNLVLFAGLFGSILFIYRPWPERRRAAGVRSSSLALQRALLGPMSGQEKIALATGVGLLAGFVTQPLHGVHPAWISVLALGVLSGTRVLTVDTLRAVNWNFAFLFGVLIGLATLFSQTGLDRWMAERVAANLGDLSAAPTAFVAALCLFCFAVSLVVRWQAAAPLITIALAPVAAGAGIHPFVAAMVAIVACNCFFLPYQSTIYLALYGGTGGRLFTHAQARPMAIAYAVFTLIAVVLSVPVWRAMGLL